MSSDSNKISLRSAALIAGFSLLGMVFAAPFAELYMYPKIMVSGNAAETTKNILANLSLFRTGILCYVLTFIFDLTAAWALYILMRPVNENLSRLTALFRIVYGVIALVALINLYSILRLLGSKEFLTAISPDPFSSQVMNFYKEFKSGWAFGLLFFGIHLVLLGYMVFRSDYIPKILGILLIIAGLGYMANPLKPILYPTVSVDFARYTFYGELIFMLWLLIRGYRIKETKPELP
jgi:hypothetical protein